jgi:hypothetical protein
VPSPQTCYVQVAHCETHLQKNNHGAVPPLKTCVLQTGRQPLVGDRNKRQVEIHARVRWTAVGQAFLTPALPDLVRCDQPIKPALCMALCGLTLGAEPGALLEPTLGYRQWPLVLAARPGNAALALCPWLLWGQKPWWTLRITTSALWLSPSHFKSCSSAFWFSCDTGSTLADFCWYYNMQFPTPCAPRS